MTRRKSFTTASAFLTIVGSLAGPAMAQELPPPVFPTPQQWEQRAPSELGMNAAKLEEAKAYSLTRNGAGIVTRNGYQVASWGIQTDRYHLFSVTKAVGALLLGHATKVHGLKLSDTAVSHYAEFGAIPDTNHATGFIEAVTLEHLATHSAGFEKPADAPDLEFQPGTRWLYSDGGANWLADVLTFKYQEDMRSVLKREFLDLLGITLVIPGVAPAGMLEWRDIGDNPRGTTIGGVFPRREFNAGVHASVDAMARIGLLVERKGTWNGVELVPAAFIDQMVAPAASIDALPVIDGNDRPDARFPNANKHHGFFWWNNADGTLPNVPRDAHWAWGLGDHLIVVIPSLRIVAARVSGRPENRRAPYPWKDSDLLCRSTMCAHYDALDPFLTPIAQSVDGSTPTPPPPPGPGAPAITLTSNPTTVTVGGSATLTWSATNADACTASNGWSGTKATSGTEAVTVSQTATYVLSCTGAGGTTESSVTVTANAPAPAPPPPAPAPPPEDSGGGGGMFEWWTLLALAVLGGLRRAFVPGRRRNPIAA